MRFSARDQCISLELSIDHARTMVACHVKVVARTCHIHDGQPRTCRNNNASQTQNSIGGRSIFSVQILLELRLCFFFLSLHSTHHQLIVHLDHDMFSFLQSSNSIVHHHPHRLHRRRSCDAFNTVSLAVCAIVDLSTSQQYRLYTLFHHIQRRLQGLLCFCHLHILLLTAFDPMHRQQPPPHLHRRIHHQVISVIVQRYFIKSRIKLQVCDASSSSCTTFC